MLGRYFFSKLNSTIMKYLLSLILASSMFLSIESVTDTTDNRTEPFLNPLHVDAEIISNFGIRTDPVTNSERMHNGIDFKASIGDSVYTAAKGTVKFAGRKDTYGNMIEIQHNNGFVTRYAQLSEFQEGIVEGSEVESGQLVAFAGRTGFVAEAILHFEILLNGEAMNPLLYME